MITHWECAGSEEKAKGTGAVIKKTAAVPARDGAR
jgi:hypothetical protein